MRLKPTRQDPSSDRSKNFAKFIENLNYRGTVQTDVKAKSTNNSTGRILKSEKVGPYDFTPIYSRR